MKPLTLKMRAALDLLREHDGCGDVWLREPTRLIHGTPAINYSTAVALKNGGYIDLVEMPQWEAWGEAVLSPDTLESA